MNRVSGVHHGMNLPEVEERRLVIAIDYGTTYTGVAIATPVGNRANLEEIDIVQDWGSGQGNHDKIPSVISYSLSENSEQQWGASLSPKSIAMVHTKLQLDVDDTSAELDLILQLLDGSRDLSIQYIKDSAGEPKYPRKGPEEIVTDYLGKVFERLLQAVASFTDELRQRIPVDIVVTIPAEWHYRAKNSTFRALTDAGFNKETFPQLVKMILVSEPEAAAIYTARYLKERRGMDFLKVGECFVLCDAGGGTVDVVSYRVKQLRPTFEIEAVTRPTGAKCGSIFINLAFKTWLRALLGDYLYQALDEAAPLYKISSHDAEGERMRELMKKFDAKKRQFPKDQRDIKLDLPEPYHNLNLDSRVVGGEITIPYPDMVSFFEPRADRIVELIQGQLEQIERIRKTRLRNVFLVGGFAQSPYLRESIEESLNARQLELHIPDTSWTAVVRGACIFGIESSANRMLSTMTACIRSYGLSSNAPYSNVDNNSKDLVKDTLTGTLMANEQMIWMIKKGDLILSTETKSVTATFARNFSIEAGSKKGKIQIYAFDGDDLPDRLSNSLGELHIEKILQYDLTSFPIEQFQLNRSSASSTTYLVANLDITIRLSLPTIHLSLSFKDHILDAKMFPERPTNSAD